MIRLRLGFVTLVGCVIGWSAMGCGGDDPLVLNGQTGRAGAGGTPAGAVGGAAGVSAGGAGAAESDVISVEEGNFQSGDAPAENGAGALPAIVSLTGPAAVTNGGTAILHAELASPLESPLFLVSLVGDTGYHTVPVVDPDGDGVYDIGVQVSGEASQPSLTLRVAVTDGMGNVGAYAELELELVQSGMGDVKITLSFDRTHDLDLHVVEPNGEEVSFENDASATGGRLDLDSGQRCEPSPANSENIFWPPSGAPSGEYRVTVHNYEQCTPGEIAFTVRIAYDSTVNTFRGSFADGTVGDIFEVDTFTR